MSTGDRIVICTACGQSYYFQNGHTCITRKYPTTAPIFEKPSRRPDIYDHISSVGIESVPDLRLDRIISLLEAILEKLNEN